MIKNSKKHLAFIIPTFIAFATIQSQNIPINQEPGVNISYMDLSVKPSDDFFRFVNGTWFDNTEIPNDRTSWGNFDELRRETDKEVMLILTEALASSKYKSDSDQGKALNLYKTILDTVNRNKRGLSPLKPYLKQINSIKNTNDLQRVLIEMEPIGGLGFFGIYITEDAKNSNRNIITLGPSSLGLPDRDYYIADDFDSKEKREKYVLHIAKMLGFLGENKEKAMSDAKAVLALETAMSKASLNRVERRDERNTYNPMAVSDLQKISPSIDWKRYLNQIGFKNTDSLIVSQPKYMAALELIFKENKVADWKSYMRWTLLKNSSGSLSTTIEIANWEFYGKTLKGSLKQKPRDENALNTVNSYLGEALGKLYVEKKFPPEAKVKAEKMIQNIFLAFENRINNLPWMSAETRVSAIEKLHQSKIKIGYPDKWKDYATLSIKSPEEGGSYFENLKNLSRWLFNKNKEDLYKPVDKTQWYMSPQTVNAYYNPAYNEIVFPAAILQPPFYNYKADEAINYGGIGAVIGHEISHGFDDSGSRYDANGNLNDWWTAEDLKQFTSLTEALATQYSVLEPLPGVFVDGKFTLGENIGDLGGVNAAYDGLQLYLKENKNPGLIDGYTPEQRFFISWATIWRSKMRDEAIKNMVKTDPHSPGKYRAYMPLLNIEAFYEAFDIKEGDGMYLTPEKRVKIW